MSERDHIIVATSTFEGFSKLIGLKAWNQSWVIRGRVLLLKDLNGHNVCDLEWRKGFLPDHLAPVVSVEELKGVVNADFSYGFPTEPFPGPGTRCPHCSGGWTIENFWQRHVESGGPPHDIWHTRCWALRKHYEERKYFLDLLASVSLATAPMIPIENGYWREGPRPWFKVLLPGGDITIGWRKRVISISCPDYVGVDRLFPEENVTKGPDHIHAWSADKAAVYLQAIAASMRFPRET